jgi:arylsulfatase A-like enzyme
MRSGNLSNLSIFCLIPIAALAIGACADKEPALGDVPVIIYVVDTLRADRLGLYGHGRPTSPNIDSLAAESVVFDQAYAAAPWTPPSVASLMTSTYPCEHRVISSARQLNSSVSTLAESLMQSGYHTGGYYENKWVGSEMGLSRGFSDLVYRDYPSTDTHLSDDVEEFLDKVTDDRFHLYLHTMEPHDPYLVPPIYIHSFGRVSQSVREDVERVSKGLKLVNMRIVQGQQNKSPDDILAGQNKLMSELESHRDEMYVLYDSSVAWADDTLGRVVNVLKEKGIWNKAIFVLLSDHGEEIGERGGWGHGQSIYGELMRVPLLIHFPGNEMAGMRVSSSVSLVDVMPTILDYLDLKKHCRGCRGRSLLPMLRGSIWADTESPVYTVRIDEVNKYAPWDKSRGAFNVGIRQGRWQGIWNDQPATVELYDVIADPGETRNLSSQYADLAADMRQHANARIEKCQAWLSEPVKADELSEETKKELRALGYLP